MIPALGKLELTNAATRARPGSDGDDPDQRGDLNVAHAFQRLLDSEIRVTMDLYSHVAPALQREAADQMDALLAAKQA